jgi:hypothetical protein
MLYPLSSSFHLLLINIFATEQTLHAGWWARSWLTTAECSDAIIPKMACQEFWHSYSTLNSLNQ